MLVQLERIVIPAEKLALPIPSLSKRQFIVAKVKRTLAEERLSRELFWYREELLNRIQASWNEVRLVPPVCVRIADNVLAGRESTIGNDLPSLAPPHQVYARRPARR